MEKSQRSLYDHNSCTHSYLHLMIPTKNMHFICILGMHYQCSRKLNILVDIKPHWLITILFMCHLVTFAQNYFHGIYIHAQYWLHVQNIIFLFFFHTLRFFIFFQRLIQKNQDGKELDFNERCDRIVTYWSTLGTDPIALRLDTQTQADRVKHLIR